MSLQFKRSSASGVIPDPSLLEEGEFAINMADQRLFTKSHEGKVIDIGTSREYVDSNFLRTSGGVLTGRLEIAEHAVQDNANVGINDLVTRRYVDGNFGSGAKEVRNNTENDDRYVNTAGDTVTGQLLLTSSISHIDAAVNKKYVDGKFLPKAGGTVTGNVSIQATPTASQHVVTKGYSDSNYINTSGDSMGGYLTLVGEPTVNKHASTKQYVDETVSTAVSDILNKIFPVGHIFMSYEGKSPSSLGYPGTWYKMSEDRFLLGSSGRRPVKSTGGEENHRLTVDEIPNHQHGSGGFPDNNTNNKYPHGRTGLASSTKATQGGHHTYYEPLTTSVGGGGLHNNMPPYMVVAMYRRAS